MISDELIPRILVAGIGNILLQDDGFGPQAIGYLQAQNEIGSEAELLDLGTPALDFIDYFIGRDTIILLDALAGGGEPGEVLVYTQEQLKQQLPGMRLSAHQPALHETLLAAEASGISVNEVMLIGVVGASFEVGTELTAPVSRGMERVLPMVCEILSRHGVPVRSRGTPDLSFCWWKQAARA